MRTAQAIAAMEFLRGKWLNEDYQISRKRQYNKVSQCMKQERKPRLPSPAPTPSQSALVSAKWQSGDWNMDTKCWHLPLGREQHTTLWYLQHSYKTLWTQGYKHMCLRDVHLGVYIHVHMWKPETIVSKTTPLFPTLYFWGGSLAESGAH